MKGQFLRVVFLGPPGSGKGTMAKMLEKESGRVQIAMGDILRDAVRRGTALGLEAAKYINAGRLVPDEISIGITREKLSEPGCKNGFILDGFPRNLVQGQALEQILSAQKIALDKAVYFAIPLALVVDRLTGRRSCKQCGAVYHLRNNPPRVAGRCDLCRGELYQREDDSEEVIKQRFKVYAEQTAPLIEFYKNKGKFVEIDASLEIKAVFENLLKVLGMIG